MRRSIPSDPRTRLRTGLGALLFLTLATSPLAAWERDVHFVLTWWLAVKAGFTDRDARDIAGAAQEPDDGYTRPAVQAILIAISTGDDATLKQVQKYHFPSDVRAYFGDPKHRPVVPDSADAAYLVNTILGLPASTGSPARDLRALGDGLHPLQDSWSHAGESDLPLRPARPIKPEKMWSHPLKRGGWDRHDADITSLDPGAAMATAARTWEVLDRFAASRQKRAPHGVPGWRAIESDVNTLVKAATKSEKLKWMTDHGLPAAEATAIADTLNDPGSILPPKAALALRLIGRAGDAPAAVRDALQRFLDDWLGPGDFMRALEHVDVGRIAEQLRPVGSGGSAAVDPVRWARKFLAMWRIADHGRVNQLGHGNPRAPGYADLPERPLTDGPLAARPPAPRVEIAPGAIVAIDPEVLGVPNAFGAVVTFPQMPRDAVLVVMAPGPSGRWVVVRFWPAVS